MARSDYELTRTERSPSRIAPLIAILRERPATLAVVIVLSIVGAGASLLQPVMVNILIDEVSQGRTSASAILWIALLLLGAGIAGAFQQFLLQSSAESAVFSARRRLVNKLLHLEVREYDTRLTGDLVSRVTSDTTLLRGALTGGLVEAVSSALVFSGAMIAMMLLDGVLFAITLGVVALAAVSIMLASSRVQALTEESQEAVGSLSAGLTRALGGIRTIRASGASLAERNRLDNDARRALELGVRVAKVEAVLWPVTGLAFQCSFLAILGIGGSRVAAGVLSVADLVSYLLFLFMMIMPLGQIFTAVASVRTAMGALSRIQEIVDLPTEGANDVQVDRWPQLSAEPMILEFRDVSFTYEGGEQALSHMDLAVPRGRTTAIVGPSGAGKSTLLALVERFYEPSHGAILFCGADLRDLPRSELRRRIGYVEQSAPILAGTIRENLRLSVRDADEDACREVLAKVGLLERVGSHPGGLDAALGEDGAGLSGGERQRLAIARALLADAPLLLLDEPTASLDSRSERLLQETLKEAARNRTVLIVAHRLSTVLHADQIVVVEGGTVIGVGTHAELLTSCPVYHELAMHQLLA